MARGAEEIAAASERNRMVAEPYTKLMCSFPTVDLAAALVVTPAHLARRPAIRPLAIARSPEAGPPSVWAEMDRPAALHMAVGEAFRLSATTPDDAGAFDLYSCFPAAVLAAADALGLGADDPRRLTASGGLPYFGGPGASYSLHGLACLFEDMRCGRFDSGRTAVAVGVGGMLTDFSVGVYGFDGTPFRRAELPGPEHAAVAVTPVADGPAVVEAMTVLHDRDRGPVEAPVIARLPSGARTGARCADPDMAGALAGRSLVGSEVELATVGNRVCYRLPS